MDYKENTLSRTSLIIAVLLVAAASTYAPRIANVSGSIQAAYAQQQDGDVDFVSNIEMMRGHIMMAVDNKEKNNLEFAQAHAAHPIAELYTLIESEIQEHYEPLNAQLNATLGDLPEKADSLSAADFSAEADKINGMLDQAVQAVVPETKRSDVKFNASVIGSILSVTKEEYKEAVKDGKIEAMVEYHDAHAFSMRAESVFNSTMNQISEEERDEGKELFAKLKTAIANVEEPATVETLIDELTAEINEGAGVEEEPDAEITATQYIENAKQLLEQLSEEYGKGNFTGAEKLATLAYLENYENVESELKNRGSEGLVEETEELMRVQLREMIQSRVTQEQMDAHIAKINEKLDQAAVVVPEFPVSVAIIMASAIGLVIMAGKFRIASLLGRRG